jgi:hypothetical protein
MEKNPDSDPGSGSKINIPDNFSFSASLETGFRAKILKFCDADPGSGIFLTLDPGFKKFGSSNTAGDLFISGFFLTFNEPNVSR